jgi:hypothetical protein
VLQSYPSQKRQLIAISHNKTLIPPIHVELPLLLRQWPDPARIPPVDLPNRAGGEQRTNSGEATLLQPGGPGHTGRTDRWTLIVSYARAGPRSAEFDPVFLTAKKCGWDPDRFEEHGEQVAEDRLAFLWLFTYRLTVLLAAYQYFTYYFGCRRPRLLHNRCKRVWLARATRRLA